MKKVKTIINTLVAYFKINTKSTLTYRGMVVLWALGWVFSYITMFFLWRSSDFDRFAGGYDLNQLVTYYFIGVLVWAVCGWFPFDYLVDIIKNGEIIQFIFRPVDIFWAMFGAEMGWHTVSTFLYLLFLCLIYIFVHDWLIISFEPHKILLFLLSLITTSILIFEVSIVMSTAAFWLINAQGLGALYWFLLSLFGGQMLPLAFFPDFWQHVVYLLPFRYMHAFPIEIYLGKISPTSTFLSFGIAIFWIIVFYQLFRYLWHKGLKTYTAFGQ